MPVPMPVSAAVSAQPKSIPVLPEQSPGEVAAPFRWQQLESRTDYRKYLANLRAVGCPESTIEDIVRGDADRAFTWERQQLALGSSGTGPWSQFREEQLVSSLLGDSTGDLSPVQAAVRQVSNSQNGANDQPPDTVVAQAEPLFMQNMDWGVLGFSSDDQAAIAQVRQQYEGQMKNLDAGNAPVQNSGSASPNSVSTDSNSGGSAPASQSQAALQDADNQLQALLGAQAYASYEQAQYFAWFQPQAVAHVGTGSLIINAN